MHHATRAKIVKWFHEYWKEELKQGTFSRIVMNSNEVILVRL